jgi:hypothetical protein
MGKPGTPPPSEPPGVNGGTPPDGGVATGGVAAGAEIDGGVATGGVAAGAVPVGGAGAGVGVGADVPGGVGIAPGAKVAVPVVTVAPEITPPQPHELTVVLQVEPQLSQHDAGVQQE